MNGWEEANNQITKEFGFGNFLEAVDFTNKVAKLSEKINHHPDILIYGYKNVKISLTTHTAGKVTEKDYNLAKQIDLL